VTTDFRALGVATDLAAELSAAGITKPFPIQALTIPDGLDGRDVCGKAKTGSGKTLAFGIPLVERTERAQPKRPTALVLVPTRELAVQVHKVLAPLAKVRGLRVEAVYGGTSLDKQRDALVQGVDVVVATPGRLIDLLQSGAASVVDVRVLVVDEADRMADMGFLPQVEWILRRIDGHRQTLLFSATLDGEIDHLVRHYQHDPVRHEIEADQPTVIEMTHRFLSVHQLDKPKVAAAICQAASRTLLFVRTKRGADRLASQLRREGVAAGAIHGDLRQGAREKALREFATGKLPVLVATDVAARGLHIDAVDVVIHYDPAEDDKAYLHRSGRTARAGASGLVVSLILWDQVYDVERIAKRLGVHHNAVEMFSNDPRLTDLATWQPAA
jgi:superfamily II DNA/RNA helicase